MKLFVNANETEIKDSDLIPYLAVMVKQYNAKLFANERVVIGNVRFKQHKPSIKSAIQIDITGEHTVEVEGTQYITGKFYEFSQFGSIPILHNDKEIYSSLNEESTIIISDTNKVLARVVSTEDELAESICNDEIALISSNSELASIPELLVFKVDSAKGLYNWSQKLQSMEPVEYDYIIRIQRSILVNMHNITEDMVKFVNTLFPDLEVK